MSWLAGAGKLASGFFFGERLGQLVLAGALVAGLAVWWLAERHFERQTLRDLGRFEEQNDARRDAEENANLADRARDAARADRRGLRADPMVRDE